MKKRKAYGTGEPGRKTAGPASAKQSLLGHVTEPIRRSDKLSAAKEGT